MFKRLALSLPLLACSVGPGGGGGGGGGDDVDAGSVGPGLSGHVSANVTWTGTTAIGGDLEIDAGVTVTIAAGAKVTFEPGVGLTVSGTLDAQGTAAQKVAIEAVDLGGHFKNISVPTGGTVKMTYVVQVGGGISTLGAGKVTITDSAMSKAGGDWLVMAGGDMNVSYSSFGLEPGNTDTTHCELHFGGAGNTIVFTHNNVSTSHFGIMFYGGTGADLTANNWFSNVTDIDTSPGVTGDISNGWFEKGVPTAGPGATLTSTATATERLTDAGPRG